MSGPSSDESWSLEEAADAPGSSAKKPGPGLVERRRLEERARWLRKRLSGRGDRDGAWKRCSANVTRIAAGCRTTTSSERLSSAERRISAGASREAGQAFAASSGGDEQLDVRMVRSLASSGARAARPDGWTARARSKATPRPRPESGVLSRRPQRGRGDVRRSMASTGSRPLRIRWAAEIEKCGWARGPTSGGSPDSATHSALRSRKSLRAERLRMFTDRGPAAGLGSSDRFRPSTHCTVHRKRTDPKGDPLERAPSDGLALGCGLVRGDREELPGGSSATTSSGCSGPTSTTMNRLPK